MRNAGQDEAQTAVRNAGRNFNNLRYTDTTTLMAESEKLRSLLMKVKEESEKLGLSSTFRKLRSRHPVYHFMTRTWGNWIVADFIVWGSKITADGDYSHEIKIRILFGRKVMTNLDSILRIRDITLSTKVCLFKAMFIPVVMCGCNSWTLRKLSTEELMLLNCGVGEDS